MIYFAHAINGGPIKIGCSENPKMRKTALNALFPYGVELLATIEGNRLEEQFLHQCFRPYAMTLEWFRSALPIWRLIADIEDNGRPAWLPSIGEARNDGTIRAEVVAEFGSREAALKALGYSASCSFYDTFSSTAQHSRARLRFYQALKDGSLPSYIAALHAPAGEVVAA
jgi:hypothetical protein